VEWLRRPAGRFLTTSSKSDYQGLAAAVAFNCGVGGEERQTADSHNFLGDLEQTHWPQLWILLEWGLNFCSDQWQTWFGVRTDRFN